MMQEGTNSLRKLRRDWWKTKLCTACVSPLGRFLSRGGICPQCGLRVCKNCRSELQSGAWVCVLCSGGMPSDDLAKTTKSLGRDSRSIRRSWSISNPQRAQTNSPILKSYTVLYPEDGEVTDGSAGGNSGGGCSVSTGHLSCVDDCGGGSNGNKLVLGGSDQGINSANSANIGHGGINHKKNRRGINNDDNVSGLSATRQFHSLPRMSSSSGGLSLFAPSASSPSTAARALGLANKVAKRSFNSDFDKENIKRHRSFQTTLHPYNPSQVNPPSPAASINFIEETFWDYYDYEIENSSSDPSSTPRNPRKSAVSNSIAERSQKKAGVQGQPKSSTSTLVAFRTDSNRSSCERSLGETMDYDCSLKMNQFSSLSDTEINETGKYSEKEKRSYGVHSSSHSAAAHRRHSNIETNPNGRSSYHYATISSTTNPYLPASEYVYRRRHDEMMTEAPPKPERKFRNSKRSVSLNAYDGRKLFSPLRTYCVLMKENIEPGNEPQQGEVGATSTFPTASAVSQSSHHDSKSKTNLEHTKSKTTGTSAIFTNSSPISLSFSSSTPLKFNSLPRERYIRIEREDGDGSMNIEKYSSLKYPSRKSELLLGKSSSQDYQQQQQQQEISRSYESGSSSREKNVTRVPIVKDDNDHHFSTTHNFPFSTSSFPSKNRIERSQSYKEISSSRPYPYYHHYHPQQVHNVGGTITPSGSKRDTAAAQNIHPSHHYPDRSSTTVDLNSVSAGTKPLPNFRTSSSSNKGQASSLYNVWESKQDRDGISSGGGATTGPSSGFFRSEFEDGSDVVIENFIKTHSSNTLPKRRYPPSSTRISNSPQRETEVRYKDSGNTMKSEFKGGSSGFQQESTDNYLRQCSTFPRGATHRNKKGEDGMDRLASSTKQPAETLPNYNLRNNSSDIPSSRGYPNVEKLDVFFHPTPSPSGQFDVPKQHTTGNGGGAERLVPIKMVTLTGPGSSATLPHPYIRQNKKMTIAPASINSDNSPSLGGSTDKHGPSKSTDSTGPSISEVEMEIERDIFYQKTRSLDRIRPSSKSKLKSVLSIGRSSSTAENNAPPQTHHPMEIDYSDSQPYISKGRHHHDTVFSIDQLDRSYANGRNASGNTISGKSIHVTTSDLLQPQQIVHHSSSATTAPIPSPRLKRKAKLQQDTLSQQQPAAPSSQNVILCSPKINGDEMSSNNTSTTSKLIGPGTNTYGSKKLAPISSPSATSSSSMASTRLLNEPDHYTQPHQNHHGISSAIPILRNELDTSRKTNASNKSTANPISLGSTTSLKGSASSTLPLPTNNSKFGLAKETSIKADQHQHHAHYQQQGCIGMSGGGGIGDGARETSSVANHISQPSTTSVTPNYSNADSPGVNFMISNSPTLPSRSPLSSALQFDSQQQQQQQQQTSSTGRYFSSSESGKATKGVGAVAMHTSPDHLSPSQQINKKSALATTDTNKLGGGGNLHKAVRFEPHVIAMEIESEQRKLLLQQQQQMNQQVSGTAAPPPQSSTVNNTNMGINSGSSSLVGPSANNTGSNSIKPNSGNYMHRHGSSSGNKARQQHYIHASSYLPVLYHSYHQQQHKYIRKGASSNIAGGSSGKGGKKSKKYKGFVARAIAKVKSKAAAAALVASNNQSKKDSSNSPPTVYYPVGSEPQGSNNSNSTKGNNFLQYQNPSNTSNNNPSSSVITYISPQPQAQHQQPPVQQSLEESSAVEQGKKEIPTSGGGGTGMPTISVGHLTSEDGVGSGSVNLDNKNSSRESPKRGGKSTSSSHNSQPVHSTKVAGESPRGDVRKGGKLGDGGGGSSGSGSSSSTVKFTTSAGRLRKHLHKHQKGSLPHLSSTTTTTAKSGISRRMDGYLDNLDGEEGFMSLQVEKEEKSLHGIPIPSSFQLETDQITPSTTSSSSSSFTSNLQESYELFHNQTLPDRLQEFAATGAGALEHEDGERCDSLNEDEDSDNVNEDGDDDEDDGPFAFKSFDDSDFGEDEDGEADFVFYPTPPRSTSNFNKPLGIPPSSGSDSVGDKSSSARKGKCVAEPKMVVVGIPTYRSPNSRRLINSHHGKSQTSIPSANPTSPSITGPTSSTSSYSSSLSKSKETVKHTAASPALFKEPHPPPPPSLQEFSANNAISQGDTNAATSTSMMGAAIGIHKDSSSEQQQLQRSSKPLKLSEDVSHHHHHPSHEMKGLSSSQTQHYPQHAGKARQHHKNQNQVEKPEPPQSQQPFVPYHDKKQSGRGSRHYENEGIAAAERGRGCEHERNVDVDDDGDHDEDTLQKDVHTNTCISTTTSNTNTSMMNNNNNVAESRSNERVTTSSSGGAGAGIAHHDTNPHDAKDFLRIATPEGRIASTTTAENSTGGAGAPCNSTVTISKKNDEGRLTDLTTTTITTGRGHQQQLAPVVPLLDEPTNEIREAGLRHGTSANVKHLKDATPNHVTTSSDPPNNADGGEDEANELLNLKNNLNSSEESSSAGAGGALHLQQEQARTSWASSNSNKKNPCSIPSTNRKNHNTVTTTNQTKDVERLQRLEVVKKQQRILTQHPKDFKIPGIESGGGDNNNDQLKNASDEPAYCPCPPNEQPNSLETQCANDQGFLSESEVQSSGKSPSPSPRFRSKKQLGRGGGGGRVVPKFQTGKPPAGGGGGGGRGDSEEDSSHLLNTRQTRNSDSPANRRQRTVPESESLPSSTSRDSDTDCSSPLLYPDSGPVGMSILPPQQHPAAVPPSSAPSSAAGDTANYGKFKSRVLLNSDDLEDDEELSHVVSDVLNKVANNNSPRAPGRKNITTVEISGDVGIVSNNLHNVANIPSGLSTPFDLPPPASIITRQQQRTLSSDHLQSSGLSLIQQPTLLDLDSSSSDDSLDDQSSVVIDKLIEPEIQTKLVDNLLEVGSSVSANESSSGGDNDTEKTSDDNSSDWQSESTNTVIFRGNPSIKKQLGDELLSFDGSPADHEPISSAFFTNPSYLDPEIQINNITVGGGDYDHDEDGGEDNGNCATTPSSSDHAVVIQGRLDNNSKISSSGTVNVGYKASKVNKVSTDLIIGIKKSSTDSNNKLSTSSGSGGGGGGGADDGVNNHDSNVKVGSKRKFDKNNDVSSSSSSSTVDSSEELGKSNETLTDIPEGGSDQVVISQHHHISAEEEMVMHQEKKVVNGNRLYVQNSANKSLHQRRESPEGQEQEVPDQSCSEKDKRVLSENTEKVVVAKVASSSSSDMSAGVLDAKDKKMEDHDGGEVGNGKKKHGSTSRKGTISKEKILQNVLNQIPSRSSPDGADADKSDRDVTPEPETESPTPPGVIDNFDVTSDEDSWVEEILFEDEDDASFEEAAKKLPPPLDLTLHTIVEESCEESEAENSGHFYQPSTSGIGTGQKNQSLSQSESNANELEKYFNFGIYTDPNSGKHSNSLPHEESEFSDTFSESSFSLQEDDFDNGTEGLLDPAELASTRLEKYFYNLGGPQTMMNPMNNTIISQHHHHADSDSVGSESDSDNSVLEKRKKVLKHHRRSADFDEEFGDKVSDEEDSFGFGQDGFDTIKKTARKTKKSGSEGSINNDNASTASNHSGSGMTGENIEKSVDVSSMFENKSPKAMKRSDSEFTSKTSPNTSGNDKPVIKVNRSNSFTWSSDEEVNIMMSKLRQLIKNLIKSKAEAGSTNPAQPGTSRDSQGSEGDTGSKIKDKQLVYLENELIRLMKTDNLKNIVEYLSSEESDVDDVYKFIKVVNSSGSTPVDLSDLGDLGDLDIDDPNLLENLQSTMQVQPDGTIPGSPKSSPALLAKVMHHIGNRLNMWMKDEGNLEDDNNDDNVTIKCAPSVSSDLNEDRFSWKGSFESALAAKRQSVGSTDSISSSDYGPDKSMLRSSSLHHLTTSQPIEENREEEEPSSSLPRMTNLCNSLPRLNQPNNPAISRAHSLVMTGKNEQPGTETYPISISGPVKSARYRPPGFQPSMKAKRIDTEEKASPAILSQSTPVLTQDPAILKNRSDSMGSIFHDVKPLISVKGQVEFGLQYNYKLACLEVKVVGCRDLAAADSKRNRSDPYVKAYLLPDKSKAGKRKTKTKKNTMHPVFDEVLKFPLTLSDLQNRTLWLSVWHSDMFGKNEFLGEVLVNLKDRVFDDPNPSWWDLQEMSGQMEDMPKGDIVIALKWQPKTDSTGNLSVLVKEAKNLVPVKNGSPSTFVKCALLSDKTRKQKTSICRRNFNPIWNQTLLFEDVDDEGVEITIWNHDLLASHDLIGTVRLEYDNPLWDSMISRPSFWVEGGLKLS